MDEELGMEEVRASLSRGRAYYSPGMEEARPLRRGRRPGRGVADSPHHLRLVRLGFLVVAPALVALFFAVSTPGVLPRAPLEPIFDGKATVELAGTLSTEYPARVPGTVEAEGAARWYHETMAGLGLVTEDDTWTADLPDLGGVTLRNVVTVVPGRSSQAVLVLAHRDNAGTDLPEEDNASGTAALIELAKAFAPTDLGSGPEPQRTLVFVSTDAGVYGGAGALRFGATSPYVHEAVAAVVLDGIGGAGRSVLEIAGDTPVSSARALVGTASARIAEQTGSAPLLPDVATQLVGLGIPLAIAEQGRLLEDGVATITLSTSQHHGAAAGSPGPATHSTARIESLGSAAEQLVDSLDLSVGAPFRTTDNLYFSDRVVSGWAVRLTLVLLTVPFALGLADLLARSRRRHLAFKPALRGARTRVLIWLFGALLVGVGALTDLFPTGDALPLSPFSSYVASPSIAGLAVLAIVFGIVWLAGRRRLVPSAQVSVDDRAAGLVVALAMLGVLALVLALAKPYALVFVLPSLYAWLWIRPDGRLWARTAFFVAGLVGPVAGLVLLARELELALARVPLYAVGLVTVGYVSLGSVLLAILWLSAAAQVGAVALGRYGPYAGGQEPPPRGAFRRALTRSARSRQSSRR
jgi:hypothetical protein